MPLSYDGYVYRCIISGNCEPNATSINATLSVNSVAGGSFMVSPINGATGVKNWPKVKVQPVGGATSYTVEMSSDPNFGTIDFSRTSSNPNDVQFVDLGYGVTYYVRVSTNVDGYGPIRSFSTNSEPVVWLSNPVSGATNIELDQLMYTTWLPNDITDVDWEFNPSSWFNPSTAILSTTTARNNSSINNWYGSLGLQPNTRYYVRLRAHTANITSTGWGIKKYFTTGDFLAGSYVTSPVDGATNQRTWLNFKVLAVDGASNYTVELSTDPGFGIVDFSRSTTTTNVNISGLMYNTTYYARVTTNLGGYGQVTSFTTRANPLAFMTYPFNGSSGVALSNKANCNWPDTDVEQIVYEFSTNSNMSCGGCFSDTNITVVLNKNLRGTARFDSIGLQASTTYYVRVTAYTGALTGNLSGSGPIRSFTTAAAKQARRLSKEENIVTVEEASYKVYPNPFDDEMVIRVDSKKQENLMVRVSDLTGKIVYQSTRHQTNETLRLGSELEPGMYMVHLVHGDQSKLIKAIKK